MPAEFSMAPDEAYRSVLDVLPAGQRWFSFDVPIEEARAGLPRHQMRADELLTSRRGTTSRRGMPLCGSFLKGPTELRRSRSSSAR